MQSHVILLKVRPMRTDLFLKEVPRLPQFMVNKRYFYSVLTKKFLMR